jgi:predicted RNase H-like HicB family nuclease
MTIGHSWYDKRSAWPAGPRDSCQEVWNGENLMLLTAVFIQVPEGYIAFVEKLPAANTQGTTLDEARENLQEAAALVMEANRELAERSLSGQTVTKEPSVLAS